MVRGPERDLKKKENKEDKERNKYARFGDNDVDWFYVDGETPEEKEERVKSANGN